VGAVPLPDCSGIPLFGRLGLETQPTRHQNTTTIANFQPTCNTFIYTAQEITDIFSKGGGTKVNDQIKIPTHKRNEGRAPVWSYEFMTKAATLQRGSANFAARLNVNFGICMVVTDCKPFLWNS
jgi:predicted Zn-dependent protease